MMQADVRYLLVLSFSAGLLGGCLSSAVLADRPVEAQEAKAPAAQGEPQVPKVLSAEEFRVVDIKGRTRAVLGLSAQGEPILQLRDENDTYIVWLGISEESGLAVRDKDGKTRLVLGLDPSGDPSLTMRDRNQKMKSIHP